MGDLKASAAGGTGWGQPPTGQGVAAAKLENTGGAQKAAALAATLMQETREAEELGLNTELLERLRRACERALEAHLEALRPPEVQE